MIRLMVVEDHEVVRDAVARFLSAAPDIEVVAMACSIREALPLLDKHRPRVVLVDLVLDDGNGMELARALRRDRRTGRVLVLTGQCDAFSAAEALAGGAAGYVLKSQPSGDLLAAIRAVDSGASYVAPAIAAKLADRQLRSLTEGPADPRPRIDALSRREHDVFRQVVAGYGSKDIANRLSISLKTVETHRTNMNRKLDLRTTADLIRFAVAHGIPVAPVVSGRDRSSA